MAAYKTSAADAKALASQWYQQGLGRAPDAAGLQHWISEIQKDGSNTAWQNFSGSPEAKQAGAAAKFAAAKTNPIELTPGAGQLPGTAHGAVTDVVQRNESWLKPLATGLASTLGSPLLGAAVSGAWNYADNHDPTGALVDAAKSYGVGKLASGLGNAAGKLVPQSVKDLGSTIANSGVGQAVGQAANTIGQAATNAGQAIGNSSVGQAWDQNVKQPVQSVAQTVAGAAGPMGGAGGLGGIKIPGFTQGGGQPVSVGGLAGQVGNFLTGNNGMNALGAAAAANAAYLGQKSSNYAQNALDTQQRLFDAKGGLRSAGIAGMQNPTTPALADLGAQRQVGNPFAKPIAVSNIGSAPPAIPVGGKL